QLATFLELFLPLALCVLLVVLRRSQPVTLELQSEYEPKPLPSAGWISLIESTCDNYVLDKNRFRTFPDASTNEFLASLDEVVRFNVSTTDDDITGSVYYISQKNLLTTLITDLKSAHWKVDAERGVYSVLIKAMLDDFIDSLSNQDQAVAFSTLANKSQFRRAMSNIFKKRIQTSNSSILKNTDAEHLSDEALEEVLVTFFLNEGAGHHLTRYWEHARRIKGMIDHILWLYSIVQHFPLSETCVNKYMHESTDVWQDQTYEVSLCCFTCLMRLCEFIFINYILAISSLYACI
ncbi:hypothetical protein Tcan_18853, partial [Toxocara canis]